MPADVTLDAAPRSRLSVLRRIGQFMPLRDPFAAVGLAIYVVWIVVAIFADQLATHDPTEILYGADYNLLADKGPGREFLLGTTTLGRDVYSQLVYGSRSALLVGVVAALMVVGIGTL